MLSLKRATPEESGISSACILSMINKLEQARIPMHSLLMMRYDNIIFESYYAPYTADTLHRMFSITKSFTSIAVGLLEQQGFISLSDPISIYFKELLPDDVHPWITDMTIEDLLSMRTCHASTTYKDHRDQNWVESFFTTKPTHPSGKFFHYDTSATHTLAALVEKLTGKELLTYLKENCLNELGFSKDSYIVKDPFGSSMGGSGLMATPMDLLKFGYLINHKGYVNKKQLIHSEYIQKATMNHAHTCVTAACPSESQGYGYQFWRNEKDGFVCYGMGGQLIIFLPQYDFICVTTADTQGLGGGNQAIYNALYDEVISTIFNEPVSMDPVISQKLAQKVNHLSISPITDKDCIKPKFFINGAAYQLLNNPSDFRTVSLSLDSEKKEGMFRYSINTRQYHIPFGIGCIKEIAFPYIHERCVVSGSWLFDQTFYIKIQFIGETVGSIHVQLAFGDGDITLYIRKQVEYLFEEYQGVHLYGRVI